MGEAGPAGPGRRPHRRSRLPHNLALAQTTSSKKKRCFFLIFSDLRRSRMAPARASSEAKTTRRSRTLIAQ